MQIPDPSQMDLHDWVNGTLSVMCNYSNNHAMTGDDWQQWGLMFLSTPSLSKLNPPNPYDFADWREYGQRLAESMQAASGSSGNFI